MPTPRRCAALREAGVPVFVSNSFSKSFSLYGERVGALSVVAASSEEAARVLSQLKRLVRTNYSNPPTHGGKDRGHRPDDAGTARAVGAGTRADARPHPDHAAAAGGKDSRRARLAPISASSSSQRGMFSYSGLSKEAVQRLREEFSIYAIDTRPHLRGGAELAQYRLRGRRDRARVHLVAPARASPGFGAGRAEPASPRRVRTTSR